MIQQIFYTSRPTAGQTDVDLPEILRCARRNNPELEITGLLVVAGDTFLQLIEGDAEFLHPLVDLIATDRRHTAMQRLFDRETRLRAFPDWAMGFCDLDRLPEGRAAFFSLLDRLSAEGSDAGMENLVARLQALSLTDAAAA